MTLPLILRALRYNFERTGRTHRVQPTSGILRDFQAFSPLRVFPAPAPPLSLPHAWIIQYAYLTYLRGTYRLYLAL